MKLRIRSSLVLGAVSITLGVSPLVVGCKGESPLKDVTDTAGITKDDEGSSSDDSELSEDTPQNVGTLNLSETFKFDLPAALGGGEEASLALNGGKRSREACEVGNMMNEGLDQMRSLSNMMCHIEVEAEKIKFGVKTLILFEGVEGAALADEQPCDGPDCGKMDGPGPDGNPEDGPDDKGDEGKDDDKGNDSGAFAMWVDDSRLDEGILEIQFCEGKDKDTLKLNEFIHLEGVKGNKREGFIISAGTHGDETYHNKGVFSIDLASKTAKVKSGSAWKRGEDGFRRQLKLALSPTFVAVSGSEAGQWEGNGMQRAGMAAIGEQFGAAAFVDVHKGPDGQGGTNIVKAFFDKNGNVVAKEGNAAFVADGPLDLKKDNMPKFLPEGFAPDSFPANAWDCTTEAEVSLNPESAAHQSCDGDRKDHVDCWNESEFSGGQSDGENFDPNAVDDGHFENDPNAEFKGDETLEGPGPDAEGAGPQ
jgi:hypothetical protein